MLMLRYMIAFFSDMPATAVIQANVIVFGVEYFTEKF